MKNAFLLLAVFFSGWLTAQSPYIFKPDRDLAVTEVKDQCATGTCWSFATVSFLEAELLRLGKGSHNLSEMFNVRMTYPLKAETYLRFNGKNQFGPGSLSHDVLRVAERYGVLPDAAYSGLRNGQLEHNHGALDAMLEGMMKTVLPSVGQIDPTWKVAFDGVLDSYLGPVPERFDYMGKSYTPKSFRDAMGIVPSDYVSLSSFTHHELYERFALEVPDNYCHGLFYNVTIDDLVSVAEHALEKGFTIAWDGDVSEDGFSFSSGLAVVMSKDIKKEERFKTIVSEPTISGEMRQAQFDAGATSDDHLMHLTGSARDQNGKRYYTIKNSWGPKNDLKGYQYMSEAYFKLKTVAIMIHKDAVPPSLKGKLGIK